MKRRFESIVAFEIHAFNQSRIIATLNENKILLKNIKILEKNVMQFSVSIFQYNKIKKIFIKNKIIYKIIGGKGFLYNLFSLFMRFGMVVAIIVFIVMICASRNTLLRIEVMGNVNINSNEISNYIHEKHVNKYKYFDNSICSKIENDLLFSFENISFVSVVKKGNCLIVSIKEKLQNEEINNLAGFENIVSNHTGYVSKIQLVQGTLAVKVGDLVKKGDVLVYPYAISSKGEKFSLKPQANIELDVYIVGFDQHNEVELQRIRTGNQTTKSQLLLFGLEIYENGENCVYQEFDEETKIQYLTQNNVLPFQYVKTTYFETKIILKESNFLDVQEEIVENARKNAYTFVDDNVIIKNEKIETSCEAGKTIVYYILETTVMIS